MLMSIMMGTILTTLTVMIHAVGTAWWITRLRRHGRSRGDPASMGFALRLLCATSIVLFGLHIAEVGVWAVAYLMLPQLESLNTLEEAIYFSTVTFASLGYGDIVIAGPWRLLSAIQAMSGLFVFGWSTALLFAVVERIWQLSDRTVS